MATSGPSERKSANVQGTGAKGNTDAWQRGQAGAAGSQPVPAPLGVHLEWEGEQETGPGLPAAWPDLEKPDLVTRGFFADAIQHVPIDTKVRVVIDSSIEPALAKPTVKKDNDKRLRGLHAARAQAIADSHREYQQRRREHPLAEDGNTCNCNHVGGGKSTKADLESARRRAARSASYWDWFSQLPHPGRSKTVTKTVTRTVTRTVTHRSKRAGSSPRGDAPFVPEPCRHDGQRDHFMSFDRAEDMTRQGTCLLLAGLFPMELAADEVDYDLIRLGTNLVLEVLQKSVSLLPRVYIDDTEGDMMDKWGCWTKPDRERLLRHIRSHTGIPSQPCSRARHSKLRGQIAEKRSKTDGTRRFLIEDGMGIFRPCYGKMGQMKGSIMTVFFPLFHNGALLHCDATRSVKVKHLRVFHAEAVNINKNIFDESGFDPTTYKFEAPAEITEWLENKSKSNLTTNDNFIRQLWERTRAANEARSASVGLHQIEPLVVTTLPTADEARVGLAQLFIKSPAGTLSCWAKAGAQIKDVFDSICESTGMHPSWFWIAACSEAIGSDVLVSDLPLAILNGTSLEIMMRLPGGMQRQQAAGHPFACLATAHPTPPASPTFARTLFGLSLRAHEDSDDTLISDNMVRNTWEGQSAEIQRPFIKMAERGVWPMETEWHELGVTSPRVLSRLARWIQNMRRGKANALCFPDAKTPTVKDTSAAPKRKLHTEARPAKNSKSAADQAGPSSIPPGLRSGLSNEVLHVLTQAECLLHRDTLDAGDFHLDDLMRMNVSDLLGLGIGRHDANKILAAVGSLISSATSPDAVSIVFLLPRGLTPYVTLTFLSSTLIGVIIGCIETLFKDYSDPEIVLIHNDKVLSPDLSLEHYGISTNTSMHVKLMSYRLSIRLVQALDTARLSFRSSKDSGTPICNLSIRSTARAEVIFEAINTWRPDPQGPPVRLQLRDGTEVLSSVLLSDLRLKKRSHVYVILNGKLRAGRSSTPSPVPAEPEAPGCMLEARPRVQPQQPASFNLGMQARGFGYDYTNAQFTMSNTVKDVRAWAATAGECQADRITVWFAGCRMPDNLALSHGEVQRHPFMRIQAHGMGLRCSPLSPKRSPEAQSRIVVFARGGATEGATMGFEISPSARMADLRSLISAATGHSPDKLRIMFNGHTLTEDGYLYNLGIVEFCTIFVNLLLRSVQLLIKISGRTITIPITLDSTVGQLKMCIHDRGERDPSCQLLVQGGKMLDNDRTLESYNLREGSSLELLGRLKGGPGLKRSNPEAAPDEADDLKITPWIIDMDKDDQMPSPAFGLFTQSWLRHLRFKANTRNWSVFIETKKYNAQERLLRLADALKGFANAPRTEDIQLLLNGHPNYVGAFLEETLFRACDGDAKRIVDYMKMTVPGVSNPGLPAHLASVVVACIEASDTEVTFEVPSITDFLPSITVPKAVKDVLTAHNVNTSGSGEWAGSTEGFGEFLEAFATGMRETADAIPDDGSAEALSYRMSHILADKLEALADSWRTLSDIELEEAIVEERLLGDDLMNDLLTFGGSRARKLFMSVCDEIYFALHHSRHGYSRLIRLLRALPRAIARARNFKDIVQHRQRLGLPNTEDNSTLFGSKAALRFLQERLWQVGAALASTMQRSSAHGADAMWHCVSSCLRGAVFEKEATELAVTWHGNIAAAAHCAFAAEPKDYMDLADLLAQQHEAGTCWIDVAELTRVRTEKCPSMEVCAAVTGGLLTMRHVEHLLYMMDQAMTGVHKKKGAVYAFNNVVAHAGARHGQQRKLRMEKLKALHWVIIEGCGVLTQINSKDPDSTEVSLEFRSLWLEAKNTMTLDKRWDKFCRLVASWLAKCGAARAECPLPGLAWAARVADVELPAEEAPKAASAAPPTGKPPQSMAAVDSGFQNLCGVIACFQQCATAPLGIILAGCCAHHSKLVDQNEQHATRCLYPNCNKFSTHEYCTKTHLHDAKLMPAGGVVVKFVNKCPICAKQRQRDADGRLHLTCSRECSSKLASRLATAPPIDDDAVEWNCSLCSLPATGTRCTDCGASRKPTAPSPATAAPEKLTPGKSSGSVTGTASAAAASAKPSPGSETSGSLNLSALTSGDTGSTAATTTGAPKKAKLSASAARSLKQQQLAFPQSGKASPSFARATGATQPPVGLAGIEQEAAIERIKSKLNIDGNLFDDKALDAAYAAASSYDVPAASAAEETFQERAGRLCAALRIETGWASEPLFIRLQAQHVHGLGLQAELNELRRAKESARLTQDRAEAKAAQARALEAEKARTELRQRLRNEQTQRAEADLEADHARRREVEAHKEALAKVREDNEAEVTRLRSIVDEQKRLADAARQASLAREAVSSAARAAAAAAAAPPPPASTGLTAGDLQAALAALRTSISAQFAGLAAQQPSTPACVPRSAAEFSALEITYGLGTKDYIEVVDDEAARAASQGDRPLTRTEEVIQAAFEYQQAADFKQTATRGLSKPLTAVRLSDEVHPMVPLFNLYITERRQQSRAGTAEGKAADETESYSLFVTRYAAHLNARSVKLNSCAGSPTADVLAASLEEKMREVGLGPAELLKQAEKALIRKDSSAHNLWDDKTGVIEMARDLADLTAARLRVKPPTAAQEATVALMTNMAASAACTAVGADVAEGNETLIPADLKQSTEQLAELTRASAAEPRHHIFTNLTAASTGSDAAQNELALALQQSGIPNCLRGILARYVKAAYASRSAVASEVRAFQCARKRKARRIAIELGLCPEYNDTIVIALTWGFFAYKDIRKFMPATSPAHKLAASSDMSIDLLRAAWKATSKALTLMGWGGPTGWQPMDELTALDEELEKLSDKFKTIELETGDNSGVKELEKAVLNLYKQWQGMQLSFFRTRLASGQLYPSIRVCIKQAGRANELKYKAVIRYLVKAIDREQQDRARPTSALGHSSGPVRLTAAPPAKVSFAPAAVVIDTVAPVLAPARAGLGGAGVYTSPNKKLAITKLMCFHWMGQVDSVLANKCRWDFLRAAQGGCMDPDCKTCHVGNGSITSAGHTKANMLAHQIKCHVAAGLWYEQGGSMPQSMTPPLRLPSQKKQRLLAAVANKAGAASATAAAAVKAKAAKLAKANLAGKAAKGGAGKKKKK